jgi:hypothetical protein
MSDETVKLTLHREGLARLCEDTRTWLDDNALSGLFGGEPFHLLRRWLSIETAALDGLNQRDLPKSLEGQAETTESKED